MPQLKQIAPTGTNSNSPSLPVDLSGYAKQSDLTTLNSRVTKSFDWVILDDYEALIRLKPNREPNPELYKFAFVTRARATEQGISIWAIYKLRPIATGEDPNTPRSYSRDEIFAEDTWQTIDLQPLIDKDAELTAALNTLQTALAAQTIKNSEQDSAITTLQGQRNDLKSAIDGYDELFARVEQRLKDADTALGNRVAATEAKNTEQDTALAAESAARGEADTALGVRIDQVNQKFVEPDLSNWTNGGGNTAYSILIPFRPGATPNNLSFKLYDRRAGYPTRVKDVSVPFSAFQYSSSWNTWVDTASPVAIWVDVTMPDNAVYRIHLHFFQTPLGFAIMLHDRHSTADNTYGAVKDIVVTFTRNVLNNIAAIPSNSSVLTVRNITGSVTSKGFDQVTLPYQIPLQPGQVLASVALNGNATTDFDANTGIVRITPNGADVAVTHTTRAGATFNGLQRVDFTQTVLAITASNQAYTVGTGLREGDLLEIQHEFNSNPLERESVWVRVQAGSVQRNFPWADPTNNTHYWTFPNPLTSTFQVRQATGGSSPKILSVKVWRDAANGYCIPTGYSVGKTYNLTVNGGTNGTFVGYEGIGPQPFILTGMNANQEVDTFPAIAGVSLLNRQAGLFTVDRALNGGDLALAGITFRNLGVKSKYFGTADNQAGDAGSTNGGHTFTQRFARGNGITTDDHSTFTLSGGVYQVRYGVNRTKGTLAWSARALFVDGTEVTALYAGDDGSHWPGAGDLEAIVDATSASKTVQIKRTSSSNNGNVDCWLSLEREEGYALPEGYQTREACTLTSVNGNFINGTTSLSIPTGTGQWINFQIGANQELKSCIGSTGLTVGTIDMKAGAAWVTVADGTTSGTLTVSIGPKNPAWVLQSANAGVEVIVGSLKVRMTTTGNRNFQLASATGAAITAVVATMSNASNGAAPGGSGLVTLNLAADGTFQSPRNYNFTAQGNMQTFHVSDNTNSRQFVINCEVGQSFANNLIVGREL